MGTRIAPPYVVQQKSTAEQLSQTGIMAALQRLASDYFASANTLDNVALVAGTNRVNHGLGRTPVGWTLVDTYGANAAVMSRTAWDSTSITFSVLAPCTVRLRVF